MLGVIFAWKDEINRTFCNAQPSIAIINGDIYRPAQHALLEFDSSEDNVKKMDVNRCKL